jgi:hypothetical protein
LAAPSATLNFEHALDAAGAFPHDGDGTGRGEWVWQKVARAGNDEISGVS